MSVNLNINNLKKLPGEALQPVETLYSCVALAVA